MLHHSVVISLADELAIGEECAPDVYVMPLDMLWWQALIETNVCRKRISYSTIHELALLVWSRDIICVSSGCSGCVGLWLLAMTMG